MASMTMWDGRVEIDLLRPTEGKKETGYINKHACKIHFPLYLYYIIQFFNFFLNKHNVFILYLIFSNFMVGKHMYINKYLNKR